MNILQSYTTEKIKAFNKKLKLLGSRMMSVYRIGYQISVLEHLIDHPEVLQSSREFADMSEDEIRACVRHSLQRIEDELGFKLMKYVRTEWQILLECMK